MFFGCFTQRALKHQRRRTWPSGNFLVQHLLHLLIVALATKLGEFDPALLRRGGVKPVTVIENDRVQSALRSKDPETRVSYYDSSLIVNCLWLLHHL